MRVPYPPAPASARAVQRDHLELRYNITPVLIETFVENPRSPARSTRRQAGTTSEPPRAAGATTGTPSGTSRRKTSGSGPSEKTGSELSTDDIMPVHHGLTERIPYDLVSSMPTDS